MTPIADAITRLVSSRTGLTFDSRRDSAEAIIGRAMAKMSITDPGRYLALLNADVDALNDLIAELTIGETYFFREPAQFKFLRRVVLPDLFRRRSVGHPLRVWSAGCASGEEAYSLAMLFEEVGAAPQPHLLATDISRAVLDRARRAVYTQWSLRGEGASAALPYLEAEGNTYRVKDRLRRHVTFAPLNLAENGYPSPNSGVWGMDLILCRNVLIYFDPETVRRVARRLFESLAPGGWLIAASSDPPLAAEVSFEAVVAEEGVFYRKPEASGGCEPPDPPPDSRQCQNQGVDTPRSPAISSEVVSPGLAEAARQVRALAGSGAVEAARVCAEALEQYPLSAELCYLQALLLMEASRDEEAVRALRRALYLDSTLAVVHFALGSVLLRQGDRDGARRAYRNARELCVGCPAEEIVPLAECTCAGQLAAAAAAQLAALDTDGGAP